MLTYIKAHQVHKDGTVALTVPRRFQRELGITKGTILAVYTQDEELKYKPIPDKLLSQSTEKHSESG